MPHTLHAPALHRHLQAWQDSLHSLAGPRPAEEASLGGLCRTLERALPACLVVVWAPRDFGRLEMLAASQECDLWLDLQQLPPRWEGTVTAGGPAARVLLDGAPVAMPVAHGALAPWQRALRAQGVASVQGWPLLLAGLPMVLEAYLPAPRLAAAVVVAVAELLSVLPLQLGAGAPQTASRRAGSTTAGVS